MRLVRFGAVEQSQPCSATSGCVFPSVCVNGACVDDTNQSIDPKAGSATLRQGSTGPLVRDLQKALVEAGYAVAIDGAFGQGTVRAVRAFQAAHPPLAVDGAVAPATWSVLRQASPKTTAQPLDVTPVAATPDAAYQQLANASSNWMAATMLPAKGMSTGWKWALGLGGLGLLGLGLFIYTPHRPASRRRR